MESYDDYDEYELDEIMDFIDSNQIDLNIEEPTFWETFFCFKSSIYSAFYQTIFSIILVNISLKLILKIIHSVNPKVNPILSQLVIIFSGLCLLFYHFFNQLYFAFIVVILTLINLSIFIFVHSLHVIWSLSFFCIALNEIIVYFLNPKFIKLRVFLMCLTMKLVSLKILLKSKMNDEKSFKKYSFLQLISYLLDPQAIPFCSYHPPNLHLTALQLSSSPFLFKSSLSLLRSFAYLLISNCLLIYLSIFSQKLIICLINYLPTYVCIVFQTFCITFLNALEFRTSHYFVCSLIESIRQFWNQDVNVAKPSMIEFPRSLVDIVIAWDIPMHGWLKECVFLPSKKKYGTNASIFITYAISSYIHGVRFEIWSVLLSLGLLTWAEFKLRARLSMIFNACIGAKKCKYVNSDNRKIVSLGFFTGIKSWFLPTNSFTCTKGHDKTAFNSKFVLLINFFFTLLTIVHLAYLGKSFELDEESQNMEVIFKTWSNLGFYSHIIGIATIIFYYMII